jgi:Rrf2 family protein
VKMTRAATYATKAVCELAIAPDNRPQASHTIAAARRIPERFLLKVLKPLADRKILVSLKGPNGGYRLARPAKEINLLEVIEAVDGPVRGSIPEDEGDESSSMTIRLRKVFDTMSDNDRTVLRGVTFADLARESTGKRAKAAGKGK